jgi:SPP1 gp7 family putative phage head morphogenesis protein
MKAEIRLRRRVALGKKAKRKPRPKKRLPAQTVGRGLYGAYAKKLRGIVEQTRVALKPLMDELDELLKTAESERRVDAGEGRRITQLIEEARRKMRSATNVQQVEALATEFASRTSTAQRMQLSRQLRSALGVELFTPDARLATLMDGFVSKNVAQIRDIPQKMITDVESTVTEALTSGRLRKDIAKELQKKLNLGRARANTIARDQIGKFHGQLNATRQKEIGVSRFIWRTVGDERVRDSHEEREGQTYSYDDPPDGELPGEPINCRCFAEPVLEDLL